MAGTATATQERFRELGFRVIEGGKSGKQAFLKTNGMAEIVGKEHKNVLQKLRKFQESHGLDFSRQFAEHCQPSTYRDSRGKDQPCFELTKAAFYGVIAQYDEPMAFYLGLAADALERADSAAQQTVLQQINKRNRELRSRCGQQEIAFDAPAKPESDANARFIDKIAEKMPRRSRGISHYGDYDEDENDPTQGGLLVPRGHYAEHWADGGMSVKRINTPDGVATMFVIGNSNGDAPTRFRLKAPNGASEVEFIVNGPRGSLIAGVATRAFCSLGPGDYQAIGFAQIRFRLAD